jgi:hypothetical protein
MRKSWRPPPWFAKPANRILFIRELSDLDNLRSVRDKLHPGGFCLALTLTPVGVPARNVTICFSQGAPERPVVRVDGPSESPHRYDDGSLCMWYPLDPRELRWVSRDRAASLIAHIAAHLVKEEWYRKTGDWVGEEIWHGVHDPNNDPEREEN